MDSRLVQQLLLLPLPLLYCQWRQLLPLLLLLSWQQLLPLLSWQLLLPLLSWQPRVQLLLSWQPPEQLLLLLSWLVSLLLLEQVRLLLRPH